MQAPTDEITSRNCYINSIMWQHLFHHTVQTVYIKFVVRSMYIYYEENTSVLFISTPLPIFSTPVPSISIAVPSIGTPI